MLKKSVLLVLILVFFLTPRAASGYPESAAQATPNEAEKPLVCVLVNSSIYAAVKTSLDQYVMDVESSGFSVNIIETNQLSDKTPKGIRSFLQEALLHGLVGCLLVGDIPEAWYESYNKEFPIDLYYMDLNGVWTDSDNDAVYDGHGGDVAPEIWVGRLKASNIAGDEVSLLKKYFDKNHRYRNGSLTLPWWRALAYIDDSATTTLRTVFTKAESDAKSSLSQMYSDITFVRERATTDATDYKSRIKDPLGYQWVYLMSHGTHHNHTFMIPPREPERSQGAWFRWGGTVHSSDYGAIDPRVFFYHLFVCSAARYTEPDYLAGSIIFKNTHGLLVIGSTEMVSTLPVSHFYGPLSEGECVGVAFKEWLVELSEKYDHPQRWFYGLTMVGDPTLRLYHELHDVAVTDVTVSLRNAVGKDALFIMVTVENQGDFGETFNVTVYCDSSTAFTRTNVTLGAGASTTITLSSTRDQIISGYHTVRAEASTVLGELNTDDNTLFAVFKGMIVKSPAAAKKPLSAVLMKTITAIFVFVTFGIAAIGFLKILMMERLPLLSSVRKHLGKMSVKLEEKGHR